MSHALADVDPALRWTSKSGRIELVDDQGGLRFICYAMHSRDVITGTDRLDHDDIRALMLALAMDRTSYHAVVAAQTVTEPGDHYPLFAAERELARRAVVVCADCRRTIRDPWPWLEFGTGRVELLGARCWRERQARRERAACAGQLAFTIDQEGGYARA